MVKFEQPWGEDIWVDASQVLAVRPYNRSDRVLGSCTIYLPGLTLDVVGTVKEVINKLGRWMPEDED